MWIKNIFSLFFGLVPAGSLQPAFMHFWPSSVLFVRLIGKTKTKKNIMLYENMIILGGVLGNIMELYKVRLPLGEVFGQIFLLTWGRQRGNIYRLSCHVSGRNLKSTSHIFKADPAVCGASMADHCYCCREMWRIAAVFLEADGSRMRMKKVVSTWS